MAGSRKAANSERRRKRTNTADNFYVDARIAEWGISKQSARMRACFRTVLSELEPSSLLLLRDKRFEVIVKAIADGISVWAYFPIHAGRIVAKALGPRQNTRVLLVVGIAQFERESIEEFQDLLRHHLGHVLLYLRSPHAQNECRPADLEWLSHCIRPARKDTKCR